MINNSVIYDLLEQLNCLRRIHDYLDFNLPDVRIDVLRDTYRMNTEYTIKSLENFLEALITYKIGTEGEKVEPEQIDIIEDLKKYTVKYLKIWYDGTNLIVKKYDDYYVIRG